MNRIRSAMSTSPGVTALAIVSFFVALIVFLLNAATTFTYGYAVVGPVLLPDMLGEFISSLLSGFMAVTFFDIAYVLALATLILACKSIAQYAVTGLLFVTTFIMSVSASVIVIILLSPLGNFVPESVLLAARYAGMFVLIAGFLVNALGTIGYLVSSPNISAKIKSSVQAAKRQNVSDVATEQLDDQATNLANEMILAKLPYVARKQADKALREFMASQGFDDAELQVDFFGGVNRD